MKVLLVNDTSNSPNMGCKANMNGVFKVLHRYVDPSNIESLGLDKPLKVTKDFNKFDLVIINAEGSIGCTNKPGSRPNWDKKVSELISMKIPVYFINFTGQFLNEEEAKQFADNLKGAHISAREPMTFRALKEYAPIKLFPDMATNLETEKEYPLHHTNGFIFNCGGGLNVNFKKKSKITSDHVSFVKKFKTRFEDIPITFLPLNANKNASFMFQELGKVCKIQEFPTFKELSYILKNSKLYFTGRHHGSIISFLSGCPVILTTSNSYKTEGDNILYFGGEDPIFDFCGLSNQFEKIAFHINNVLDSYDTRKSFLIERKKKLQPYFDGHIRNIFEPFEGLENSDMIDWNKVEIEYKKSNAK